MLDQTKPVYQRLRDVIANAMHLPRPPRLPRSDVAKRVSPMMLSFMNESRRLVNRRLKEELGVRLQYPTVYDGVSAPVSA